ncbi:MAG: FUSC family protein [Oscillospiraceae bacterium]|nr:FUSC family protein [Oscillospiraceae bacterium]
MNKTNWRFHIGQQNIKSALAATLCALVYLLIDRNPTFACIGAIFGVGGDMAGSKLYGGNRFFGTIIGGVLGMILFRLYLLIYPDGATRPLMLLFVFVGVVLLILAGNLCKWVGAIQPGGVVLCILLFNTPVESYISYSINRIVDTGIGVAVGILISLLLPRERMHNILRALHLKKKEVFAEAPEEEKELITK